MQTREREREKRNLRLDFNDKLRILSAVCKTTDWEGKKN